MFGGLDVLLGRVHLGFDHSKAILSNSAGSSKWAWNVFALYRHVHPGLREGCGNREQNLGPFPVFSIASRPIVRSNPIVTSSLISSGAPWGGRRERGHHACSMLFLGHAKLCRGECFPYLMEKAAIRRCGYSFGSVGCLHNHISGRSPGRRASPSGTQKPPDPSIREQNPPRSPLDQRGNHGPILSGDAERHTSQRSE